MAGNSPGRAGRLIQMLQGEAEEHRAARARRNFATRVHSDGECWVLSSRVS